MPPSGCDVCASGHTASKAAEPAGAAGKPVPYEVAVSAVGVGLKTELRAAEHPLTLDAGKALGGQQSAASPVQAFIGAIVACNQISLQLVAMDRGVELQDIDWHGWGVFDARKLVQGGDTNPRFQEIKVTGKVSGGASQEALDELAALTAKRCPISQSLHPDIQYSLQLTAAEE